MHPGPSREHRPGHERNPVMRKFAAIAAMSAAAAFGAVAVAGTAGAESDAASIPGVIKRTTTSYTSPSTASSPVHFLAANTRANVLCYTEGQTQNGNPYWIKIGQDGKTGFVHRDSIVPAETPPHC